MPRINFVSFTFLFAFGLGSFVGVGLALLAVALARPPDKTEVIEPESVVDAATSTATATATATLVPTATSTPVPVIRTLSTQQVHIGPSASYAILGTLNSGSEVDVQGRDTKGAWLAIKFPPGSAALGWIPADQVEGLALYQIFNLDVLGADMIDTTPSYPYSSDTPSAFQGNDGLPSLEASPSPTGTQFAQIAVATSTPRPLSYGPTDLELGSVNVRSDGSLQVVVNNLGPGDVPAITVAVDATGFAQELLTTGILRARGSATLVTRAIRLTKTTNVSVTIDPDGHLADVDRTNNSRETTLSP